MPYLRRLILLLTLSTSVLLVTVHLLHFSHSRLHHQDPLFPIISKEDAEESFKYLKQYEHSKQPEVILSNPNNLAQPLNKNNPPVPQKLKDATPEEIVNLVKGVGYPKPKPTPKPELDSDPTPEDIANLVKGLDYPKPKPKIKQEPKPKANPRPTLEWWRVAPPNTTAWHKDRNMWKVDEALQGRG